MNQGKKNIAPALPTHNKNQIVAINGAHPRNALCQLKSRILSMLGTTDRGSTLVKMNHHVYTKQIIRGTNVYDSICP